MEDYRYIRQSDIDNEDINPLPIRNGCGPYACGCSGYCYEINSYISRDEYKLQLLLDILVGIATYKIMN